jgi:hypothetical protein
MPKSGAVETGLFVPWVAAKATGQRRVEQNKIPSFIRIKGEEWD